MALLELVGALIRGAAWVQRLQAYLLRDFALPRAERKIYGEYNSYRHALHAAAPDS